MAVSRIHFWDDICAASRIWNDALVSQVTSPVTPSSSTSSVSVEAVPLWQETLAESVTDSCGIGLMEPDSRYHHLQ